MTTYNSFWEAAPAVVGGSLLLGGGARIAKGLFNLARRTDPESSVVDIKQSEDPLVEMEVPVSHEEAEELRRQGVKVKKHANVLDKFQVSAPEAFGLGALGTGAVIGGWKLTDYLVDSYRKNQAEKKRDALKNRIKSLLNDTPDSIDSELHAQMKAAEAIHFEKDATAFDPFTQVVNPLAALLGGGMMIAGIRSFNEAAVSGSEPGKIKALKNYLKKMKVKPPMAGAIPVEVGSPAGSPAEQAEHNAQVG